MGSKVAKMKSGKGYSKKKSKSYAKKKSSKKKMYGYS
tara:strand:+ start:11865 stop:11975 length:111 start_codon:yes stop_codon:yes gene_type:complete